MTVRDLKKMLRKLPNDMEVLIPLDSDGAYFSPCLEESGVTELLLEDLTEEELRLREMLNQPPETDISFLLVPCGFFSEPIEELVNPELN